MIADALPDDVEALKRLLAERTAQLAAAEAKVESVRAKAEMAKAEAEAEKAAAIAAQSNFDRARATIELLQRRIEQLRNEIYGQKSESGRRLADLIKQLEFELENAAATAAEDEIAAEKAAAKAGWNKTLVGAHLRKKPVRKPFAEHLPRERFVVPGPTACPSCGGGRLSKVGEAVTESLEEIPRKLFVKQTVREKFSCRDCEGFCEAPAPFHAIARGHVGPKLLASILYDKFGCHQPLNRQSDRFRLEGVELSVSTLADHVGACTATLAPLVQRVRAHVFAAARVHGDDTTVPVLAKGKTVTGRLWTYVRDDKPFKGTDPRAAAFYYSRDRKAEHPERHLAGYAGILQADAYAGYNRLYEGDRQPGPISECGCWSHARRKFFKDAELDLKKKRPASPLALEAVRRMEEIFAIESEANGCSPAGRLAVRKALVTPLVAGLETWMKTERAKLSRHTPFAKACDYMLKRWDAFTRFLSDGRICMTNNAAERALRGVAIGDSLCTSSSSI